MRVDISDNISVLFTEQGFTYCNCLYINDDVRALVDSGFDQGGMQGIDAESIDLVINSHHHMDHCRGNSLLPRAEVMIHQSECEILTTADKYFDANSLDLWERLMPGQSLADAYEEIGFDRVEKGYQPFDYTKKVSPIEEGQLLDFGHTKAEVWHTPGHSAGHCCFWFPNEELLFCSDICLTKAGPWYGEHMASPFELKQSIDRILEFNPPRVISSHVGELITDVCPRLTEFKSRIDKREERIYRSLKSRPADIHMLAAQNLVYRAHPTAYVVFWEKLMLLKHLDSLIRQGLVDCAEGKYFAR